MKTFTRKWILFLVCILLLLGAAVPSFGETTTKSEVIYTSEETYYLPLWHYSGKYWVIGSGSDKVKVTDKELDAYNNLSEYLSDNYTYADFSVSLPDCVKDALAEGETVSVSLDTRGHTKWKDLFEEGSYTVTGGLSATAETFDFRIKPVYHLVKNKDYTYFVKGLSDSIPLIDYHYGYNTYSLFGNGKKALQGNGWFHENTASLITSGYIHPSMITNAKGELADGYPIKISGDMAASNGYCVGDGTFVNAGAVGIQFCYPLNVVFTKTTTTWTADPTESGNEEGGSGFRNGDGGSQNDDGSQSGTNSGNGSEGTDGSENGSSGDSGGNSQPAEITIEAELYLTSETYEGQTIGATDVSQLTQDGKSINAREALSQGLATHSFDAPGAQIEEEGLTDAVLCYDDAGTYPVTLTVEAGGETDSDSKCVRVLACPSVSVNLGGSQKQNRRQDLSICVQQHPSYPVKSLIITITELESGEIITINRNFSGAQLAPVNTDHIKYRSLENKDSADDSFSCSLAFLSKFDEDRTFRYTVTAVDTRGHRDTKSADFTVVRDTPPTPAIAIDDVYYRSKGSDTAVITVSDCGSGAGSYERTWTVDGTNLQDLSFGLNKTVSFERDGVGPFGVSLTVKDLWAEETLEEYVTDADHLSGSAAAQSIVDNMAPTVSFTMEETGTAELLLLARDDATYEAIDASTGSLKTRLAAEGIDARITVQRQTNAGNTSSGTVTRVGSLHNDITAQGSVTLLSSQQTSSDFWSKGHVAADSTRVYSMNSSNTSVFSPKGSYKTLKRTYPYTISAYDENCSKLWSFSLTEALFPSADEFCSAVLAQDEQGLYLYLISNGKTLILNKKDGSMVRLVSGEMGQENYVCGTDIYTVNANGIFKLDAEGLHQLQALTILAGKNKGCLQKGRLCFLAKESGKLVYCSFDPETEALVKTPLDTADSSTLLAMDSRGYAVVRESNGLCKVFDGSGTLIGRADMNSIYKNVVPSYDSSGRINYVCGSYKCRYHYSDGILYGNELAVSSLFTDYSDSVSVKEEDDYRNSGGVEYAFESQDGAVSMILPCHVYSVSYTICDSQIQYNFYPKSKTKVCGILASSGLPPTDFSGLYPGGTSFYCFKTSINDIVTVMHHQESEADELARLKAKWLRGDCDLSLCLSYGGDYSEDALFTQICGKFSKSEPPVKTYEKGQKIKYQVYYSDWEDDPSKASYWVYTHEPGTDGLWENSGKILTAPVSSFEKNGKYTLTHWQTDSAGRGLTTAYDKDSAPCKMVFYITGSSDNTDSPPEVESISTDPGTIYAGEDYSVSTVVSDADSSSLDVKIEIYHEDETVPVYTGEKTVSKGSGGSFEKVSFSGIPKALTGDYRIAVTVSDGKGTGLGSYTFTPKIKPSLSGLVYHTDDWDSNRQNFNLKYFSKAYSETLSDYSLYCKSASPRARGKNVFWPGEELQLAAELKGEVVSVKVVMVNTSYSTILKPSGKASAGASQTFTGVLYDKTMQKNLAKANPRQVTIRFTASYKDGSTLEYSVPIIFDQDIGYWMLHRTK